MMQSLAYARGSAGGFMVVAEPQPYEAVKKLRSQASWQANPPAPPMQTNAFPWWDRRIRLSF
jgi:hypothetical protein